MAKQQVVIVGGGFGGLKVALSLASDDRFAVILISDQTDFRYYPSLYRTATGGGRALASVSLAEIFADKHIEIWQAKATTLDRIAQTITTDKKQVAHYDHLVLALGVQTNFFHIEGLQEFSYGIKTLDEAERLKKHLHKQLIDDKKLDLNYVVVGGGSTGIELAGQLPSYLDRIAEKHGVVHRTLRIELVEASPRLLPRLPKDMGRVVRRRMRKLGIKVYLNTAVKAETADLLTLNDKSLKSHTVIWTAGITNHPFFIDNAFQLTKTGKVRVDQYLQAEPNIYVIGDNADTPYSGMAQTAIYDGLYLAANLKRSADHEDTVPYKAKKPIYVIPAGPDWAAVLWGRFRIYGRLASLLRSAADLIAYHDYEPWQLATKHWMSEADEEDCPVCDN